MRPIVSETGTATCNTAKYLANVLAPLGKSDHTIINTSNFINCLKKERIPRIYKMISFNVKSLFTSVPLDKTISIALRKIYDEAKIKTNIPRNVTKELLLLRTETCTLHIQWRYLYSVRWCGYGVTIRAFISQYFHVFIRRVNSTNT